MTEDIDKKPRSIVVEAVVIAKTRPITKAHTINRHYTVREFVPDHEPRASDPHYALFNAARRRLKEAGKLVCWVCGAVEGIELHHSHVEFCLANGVDVVRFRHLWPEFGVVDDETFAQFVEGEGNLLCLCVKHHRGTGGIHCMPYPLWVMQAVWKTGIPDPGAAVCGSGDGDA